MWYKRINPRANSKAHWFDKQTYTAQEIAGAIVVPAGLPDTDIYESRCKTVHSDLDVNFNQRWQPANPKVDPLCPKCS